MWIGLTLAFASALVTNTAYSLEHDAAAALPPLSPRRPFRSAQLLLRDRRWLIAFGAETAGWLMYVAALRLAPLALVQAVAASGVAVLAFATARGHPSRLARREQVAVVLAIAGLALLALSLVETTESDQHPAVVGIIIWLAACGGGAVLLIAIPTRFGRAASLGLAAGLLFADGDISAKLVGYGGLWLIALATLIVAYARRDERAAVGIPAGRRADRGGHRDDGDQRGPDRGRVRAVRRDAAARDASRPAGRGVRVPGGERGCARAPAGTAGQEASSGAGLVTEDSSRGQRELRPCPRAGGRPEDRTWRQGLAKRHPCGYWPVPRRPRFTTQIE